MTTLITRSTTSGIGVTAKNSPLTNSELDNNFISLNDNKLERNSSIAVTTLSATGILYAATTSLLALDGTNVGIGTSTPNTNLQVYSNTATANIRVTGDGFGANFSTQRYDNTATATFLVLNKFRGSFATPLAVNNGDNAGNISFQAYGGTNSRAIANIIGIVDTYTSDTNISGYLTFNTNSGSTVTTEKMRITAAGNVGIGTSAPITVLQVAGSFSSTTAYHSDTITSLATINAATQVSSATLYVATNVTSLGTINAATQMSAATVYAATNVTSLGTINAATQVSAATIYVATNVTSLGTINAATSISSGTIYAGSSITSLATIYDSKGDVRAAPLNTRSTSGYTTVAADAGKTVAVSGNTIIGTSIHTVGDMVTFYNSSTASIAILSTGLTVYLAGTATTGTRTLAQRGIATILCVSSNTFVISGAGLT